MTHEELVEKVAASLWLAHQKLHGETSLLAWEDVKKYPRYKWVVDEFRTQARAAIKIVGEACAESAGVIVEHHRKVVEATDDNEVRHARYNAQTAAGVVQNRILSLTQGTKE